MNFKIKKMDIELTRVDVVRKRTKKTFTLEDGLRIVYYGSRYGWEENPEEGTVKVKDGIYTIEWDDGQVATVIDDSEKSKEILKYCGF